MKNRIMKKCIVLFLSLVPVLLSAHPQMGNQGSPMGPQRQGMQERWETLRIWKLTDFLELNQDQAAEFFPALQEFRKSMERLDSAEVSLQKAIINEIQSGNVNQRFVNKTKREIVDLREKRLLREHEFLNTLPEYLTPEQQAKYLVFERRFQQALKNVIQRRGMNR